MRSLLPFVITGLATGSLYGLTGVGLILTYRTSGVFNFGHGAIAASSAFLFYTLYVRHGVPWPIASLITIFAFGTVVGLTMERLTRRLSDAPEAVVVVATVGIMLMVEGYLFVQFGSVTRNFPEFLPRSGFGAVGVHISWSQVITIAIASMTALALYWFLRRARLGVAMRAVVDNPDLVGLIGDRPALIRRVAWIIGSSFAALSGILLAPSLGLDANLLTLLVVQAFGACALGLFASLPMTYAGGLFVGVAASVATKYLTHPPLSGIPSTVPFLVLLGVLLVVPTRRLPQRQPTLRSLVGTTTFAIPRGWATTLLAVGFGVLIAVPVFAGTHLPVWIAALTDVVIFGSLALLVWVSGQISLCHASFVALGATNMSHLANGRHLPWVVALLLAGLLTVPVGALVAIPALRMSGLYLALATLGFGILMQNVIYRTSWMFGPRLVAFAPRPRLWFIHAAEDKWFYYVVLVVASVSCAALVAVHRGRLGRLLRALAESPTMLSTHGLGVQMIRLTVFSISAFFAGVGGALAVTQFGSASGVGFGPIQSIIFLTVLAICGTRLIASSIAAATLLAVVPGYVTAFGVDRQTLVFGAVAVLASLIIGKRDDFREWLAMAAHTSADRIVHGPVAARTRGGTYELAPAVGRRGPRI